MNTNTSVNYGAIKKEDIIKELESTKEENEKKDEEIKSMRSDIESLKEMLLAIQNEKKEEPEKVENKEINQSNFTNDIVQLGSCLVGRHILCNGEGNEVIEFSDFGDVASIGIRILDTLMTPINKQLLRKGLIYFLDDRIYDRYSIKKPEVLNDETLDNLYKLPVQEMVKHIDKITEEKKDKIATYNIYWKIVKNIASNRQGYQDRNKEIVLASYFDTDISNSISLLQCARENDYK